MDLAASLHSLPVTGSSWLAYLAPYPKLQSRGWATLPLVALFCIIKHFGYLASLLYSLWASWLLCLVPSHGTAQPVHSELSQMPLTLALPSHVSTINLLLHYTSGAEQSYFLSFLFLSFFQERRWGEGVEQGLDDRLTDAGNKRERGESSNIISYKLFRATANFWQEFK